MSAALSSSPSLPTTSAPPAAAPVVPSAGISTAAVAAAAASKSGAASVTTPILSETTAAAHPMDQFAVWWGDHQKAYPVPNDEGLYEVCISTASAVTGPAVSTAAAAATATTPSAASSGGESKASGSSTASFPSSRMVLIKSFARDTGFRLFTNYNSRKGRDIAANPNVALLWYWPHLRRQVRVEGVATKTSAAISDAYFHSRAIDSQINSAVSQQSEVVASRAALDKVVADRKAAVPSGATTIPRPANWGGFDVLPLRVEFWANGPNRLHDRVRYERSSAAPDAQWTLTRLFP